jgi:spore maturation protein CgeB
MTFSSERRDVSDCRLLIVGNPDPVHVGAHLLNGAQALGLKAEICDSNEAFTAPWPLVKFNWKFRGHRPSHLDRFSQKVVEACRRRQPTWMISTGISPIADWAIEKIGEMGIKRLNFLTDDPWNPAHHAPWFMKTLPLYDLVFSPRRANLADLRQIGCKQVSYLPFAYAPEMHYPEPFAPADENRFAADVIFIGGADADRVSSVVMLIRAGFNVALYGGYWARFQETKAHSRGHADPQTARKAIGGAKVALCLVRQANRDGHSMRTFETPAIGACLLMEKTEEHQEIFGQEFETAAYFAGADEMVDKLRWLLSNDGERSRLSVSSHQLITTGGHTYRDRLYKMLSMTGSDR